MSALNSSQNILAVTRFGEEDTALQIADTLGNDEDFTVIASHMLANCLTKLSLFLFWFGFFFMH